METKQFKKRITETTNFNWYNSVEFNITFPPLNLTQNFIGLASFHKFLEEQILGWDKFEILPNEFTNSKNFFTSVKQEIENFVESYSTVEDEFSLDSYLRNLIGSINSRNTDVFTYDSPEIDFLLKIYQYDYTSFIGAFTYFIGDLNQNINNKKIFEGYLTAYEFKSKESKLTERANSEKTSLQQLKNNFKNRLPELDKQLVDHLKDSSDKYDDYAKRIDDFQTDKEKTYSDWFINTKGEFEIFDKDSKLKIEELEKTYKAKLKLEGPATYWSDRAKKLRRQGWIALSCLIILVLMVCDSLNELLWRTPEQIFTSYFKGDHSAAIRWSIIYITLIAFLAFCIKAISKVMFSSFHLARDSEERHTLTYFYLSLLKESEIDPEEKKLIMQSLFSRADTGLLKEDSSPTMPNDLVGKFFSGGK
ncbi:DUF6161 domain-containing protein [Flavobacterium johnsoniae]|uniref:DUF6161 domain-containing protein n=1 Tax=Flavobacterium johnsoniae TaxID=986 RepID=A0A1M5PC81_FLAJO|nr:DUF6161 domain-containing protein [Flavobacterium johnsoniae]SHG99352.1 hypothetical protein SAMN05444388_105318 [Flavobacterium johnsoniae]